MDEYTSGALGSMAQGSGGFNMGGISPYAVSPYMGSTNYTGLGQNIFNPSISNDPNAGATYNQNRFNTSNYNYSTSNDYSDRSTRTISTPVSTSVTYGATNIQAPQQQQATQQQAPPPRPAPAPAPPPAPSAPPQQQQRPPNGGGGSQPFTYTSASGQNLTPAQMVQLVNTGHYR